MTPDNPLGLMPRHQQQTYLNRAGRRAMIASERKVRKGTNFTKPKSRK